MTGSVDIEDLSAHARHIPIRFSLCTQSSGAAVASGTGLKIQNVSATITLGGPSHTFVPTFVTAVFVVTLILVDHRLVSRLRGGGHGGE